MLIPEIKARLAEETHDEQLQKLTSFLCSNHKKSRQVMGKSYSQWDRNIKVFRGEYIPSEHDLEAQAADEPEKSIIPLSYSQVQTFASFGFMLYTQNRDFYELDASGGEDYPIKEISERLLARDLRANQHYVKIYQFLLDLARTGVAPLKCWWTVDTQNVNMVSPESAMLSELGLLQGARVTSEELVKYEGNRISNISPYRFLPDARLPLTRWQEGQFVADEDEWHITNVKHLERIGAAAGTKWVPQMTKENNRNRGEARLPSLIAELNAGGTKDETDYMCSRVEGQAWLEVERYGLPGSGRRLYSYILANDRLISLVESEYLHGEYNYSLAQFSPDQESKLNACLQDTIHALQDTITFLYNSRIESVRRSLDNHIVVHPMYIDMAALESRSPIIQLAKNAPLGDMRQVVQQLETKDVTASHFNDAELLRSTMQFVTGVNDNAMGQYSGGRRSATEARSANAGSASRMKIIHQMAWQCAWAPLGKMMLSNHRQGISEETFRKVLGESNMGLFPLFAPSDPSVLVGSEDFFVFDTTLVSEKGFLAQSLQELVIAMMNSPELAAAQGFDLQKAVLEIQHLRGVQNATRFFNPPIAGGAPGLGQGAGLPVEQQAALPPVA